MAGTFCNFKIRLTTFHFDKFTVRARSGDLEASLSHTTLQAAEALPMMN